MPRPATYLWARLLARLYEGFPLECPRCGTEVRLIAFLTDTAWVTRILGYLGEPTQLPPIAPGHGA